MPALGLSLGLPFDRRLAAAAAYATWNPSDKSADVTLSGGDLIASGSSGTDWDSVRATVSKSSGKWAFEVTLSGAADFFVVPGLMSVDAVLTLYPGGDTNGIGINPHGPYWHLYNNGFVLPSIGIDWVAGDVATLLWDADTGDLTVKRNGVQVSTKSLPQFAAVEMFPAIGVYTAADGATANFGPLLYPEVGYNDGWYAE